MSTVMDVIWEGGVLIPETRLDLPEKTRLQITFERPSVKSQTEGFLDDESSGWNNLMELVGCLTDKDGATDVARNHDKYHRFNVRPRR